MNNNLKKLIVIFFTFFLTIFLLNIYIKGIETNKSYITDMNILNYIPSNYKLTIISNSTNNDIKRFINENIPQKKQDELNIIKDSIISYLGFNLQEKIENIYDNEFALTFFEKKLNKIDILLIFKLKANMDIDDITNIGEELNKSDQVIELKRLGKLNYISHIAQTKDNYIIASSNKKLIDRSLQSNSNNKIFLSRDSIPDTISLDKIKLLSISKYIAPKNDTNSETEEVNKLITIINTEDNKITLRSFSPNINKLNTQIHDDKIDNIKDIIFTNKYSAYEQNINFLYNDINQKESMEEISQEINGELLLITNDNNWILSFKNKTPNENSIDKLNFLKKYKKENLYFNNINYSIYSNDGLKIKDNNIIYEKDNPIFSLKDEVTTYISNNFDTLLTINEKAKLLDQYFNYTNEIDSYKYIINDKFFIRNINNEQLIKYYKSLKNIQYFVNTKLFSLENIKINITNRIPEWHEKIYIESNLKIL